MTTTSSTYPGAGQTSPTGTANISGGPGNDTLTGTAGNDTIDGGAGFNVVVYAGSEYDYVITRNENGSVAVAASAGTPYSGDGADQLINIQLIQFLEGSGERIIDDVSNVQSSSNAQLAFGQEFSGQTFRGDTDWFRLQGAPNQPFHLVIAGQSYANLSASVPLTGGQFYGSSMGTGQEQAVAITQLQDASLYPYSMAWGALASDGNASLSVSSVSSMMAGGQLGLNAIGTYRLVALRDLLGSAQSETLAAGTDAEYLDGGAGNDRLDGSPRSDWLAGGTGTDTLVGGIGNDTIIGGDDIDDRDVAVFSGRFSEYVIANEGGTNGYNAARNFWTVKGPDGTDWLRGVETLRFSDRDFVIDEYDALQGSDIAGRASYARLGQAITGRLGFSDDKDWIPFDFGSGVVNAETTLKISVDFRGSAVRSLYFVNVSGMRLQFEDAAGGNSRNSIDLNWLAGAGRHEFFVKGISWGANQEGGMFGGRQAFLVIDQSYWAADTVLGDPTTGTYTVTITRSRSGGPTDDSLTTAGATEQARSEELLGLGGNDQLIGTERNELFDGGDGNDTIRAGGGDDRLVGGWGSDSLDGEAGDDTFVFSTESNLNDTLSGGAGTDTLVIPSDLMLASSTIDVRGMSFDSVERIAGPTDAIRRLKVDDAQLAGFDHISGLILSGNSLSLERVAGNVSLEGTYGDDRLSAGSGSNVLFPFGGNNTVTGGGGDDIIRWEPVWSETLNSQLGRDLLSQDMVGNTYRIRGSYDGGDGSDALEFRIQTALTHTGLAGYTPPAPPAYATANFAYRIDLTQADLRSIEAIRVLGRATTNPATQGASSYYGPEGLLLSASQWSSLTEVSGASFVLTGGGEVALGTVAMKDGASLEFAGAAPWILRGTSGADSVATQSGDDQIDTGAGSDTVSAGAGADVVDVGAGDDLIVIAGEATVSDTLKGGDGNDTLRITGTDVDLSGATLEGLERLDAQSQSLALTLAQHAQFSGRISGSAGLILKLTSPGQAEVSALPPGFVGIRGSSAADSLLGSLGDDLLVGDAGNDLVEGAAGNDRLAGGVGVDTVRGGAGDDHMLGDEGDDLLEGGDGIDLLVAGSGIDTLRGGAGDDTLDIRGKAIVLDAVDGGAGADTLLVADGQDLGGVTITSIEATRGSGTVTVTPSVLAALGSQLVGVAIQIKGTQQAFAVGDRQLLSGARLLLPESDAQIVASTGVIGSRFDDSITGGSGSDAIYGGRGADRLDGGTGDDTLVGGSGIDTLVGGAGNDRFVIQRAEFDLLPNTGSSVSLQVGRQTYSNWISRALTGDLIDGGAGLDLLRVELNTNATLVLSPGSLLNVEAIEIDFANVYVGDRNVWMAADAFSRLESFAVTGFPSSERYAQLNLLLLGDGEDLNLNRIDGTGLRSLNLQGRYGTVDLSTVVIPGESGQGSGSGSITVRDADRIVLGPSADSVRVDQDSSFVLEAGAGNDVIRVSAYSSPAMTSGTTGAPSLSGRIDGGPGLDRLILEGGQIDITGLSIVNVETIQHDNATLLLTQAQSETLSFEGAGRKFIRVGNTIELSDDSDTFNGSGSEVVEGGRGNDTLSNLKTAVYSGNWADYNHGWSTGAMSGTYVVEHARGTPIDGKDSLYNVLEIQFADTARPIVIDDHFNQWMGWSAHTFVNYQLDSGTDKRVSARKDYRNDQDIFTSTLVPNSPMVVEGSTQFGANWTAVFTDVATGRELRFKSFVQGGNGTSWGWSSSMRASDRWVPGFETVEGFVPYEGGNVRFSFQFEGEAQNYAFTLKYLDDYAGSPDTLGAIDPMKGGIKGYVGDIGDTDWIRTSLVAGTHYEFNLQGLGGGQGTLADPALTLFDSKGRKLDSGVDVVRDLVGGDDRIVFRPTVTGTYYLEAKDASGLYTGSWTLTQESLDMIAGNLSTTARAEWSADQAFSVTSEVNKLGDQDWFRVWLDQGKTYDFGGRGSSFGMGNTLPDPVLALYSATGNLIEVGENTTGNDDRLVFRAVDSGWYFLAVGGSGNSSKGTYTVTGSTLKDDFGNTFSSAGLIAPGAPVAGTVSYNGDSDWLKIGLAAGQTYLIDLKGDFSDGALLDPLRDPVLWIRDATGRVIQVADDFGTGLDSRAWFTPKTTGVYYLEARSAFRYDVGAWSLSVNQAPADDYASSIRTVTSGPSRQGVGNLILDPATLSASRSGQIGMPGDMDLFNAALEENLVYRIEVGGFSGKKGTLADPYLRIFDSRGRLVEFDDDGGPGTDPALYFVPRATGEYLFEVSARSDRGMGSYEISLAKRNLPPDEAGDNVATQADIAAGEIREASLLTHGDQDWFRITLEAAKDYVFRAQGASSGNGELLDPVLEIRSGNGSLISTHHDSLISRDAFTVYRPQSAGTYFLVVKSASPDTDTGSYRLVARAPDDHADTLQRATPLAPSQTVAGGIQWASGSFGVRAADSLGEATDMDVDWFRFDVQAGEVVSLLATPDSASGLSRLMIEVVSDPLEKRTLAIGDGLETTDGSALATLRAAQAGTLYARIVDGAGATGSYTVQLRPGDASDEDANGTVAMQFASTDAGTFAVTNAKIGLPGDQDAFSFQANAGHRYRIETLAIRDGAHAPLSGTDLAVSYQPAGQAEQAVENAVTARAPTAFGASLVEASASGIVRMKVAAPGNLGAQSGDLASLQTGQYRVRVTDLGAAAEDDRPDRVADYSIDRNGLLSGNGEQRAVINSETDADLFAIQLTAGSLYDFRVLGFQDGLGTLGAASLQLLDSQGRLLSSGRFDADLGRTTLVLSVFDGGLHYLRVAGEPGVLGSLGSYQIESRLREGTALPPDDLPADSQTPAIVRPGKPVTGRIGHEDDLDWVSATLGAGKSYVVDLLGNGNGAGGTLANGVLRMLDANGNEVALDDDSGAALDPRLIVPAGAGGTVYFEVASANGDIGSWTLRLRELYSGTADPMRESQWYLDSLGLAELDGEYSGAGVLIGMIDDGIDTVHPDLEPRIDFAKSWDSVGRVQDGRHKLPFDFHGTPVAGIMVAEANNETGIVGIAYEAEIASNRVKWTWPQITNALSRQYQFDISNNSWGTTEPFADNFNSTTMTFAYEAIRRAVEDGRGGLGTVMVFSAGNSASQGANTNHSNFANAREVITVGSATQSGGPSSFSTPGASVLVAAYGEGLLTTDRLAGLGSSPTNYTEFTGTSAAAPVVSGVAALMLEANPALGYRDVQHILALSARHLEGVSWKSNGASSLNLGGLSFNDQMGFGLVDAHAAVRLAQTWAGSATSVNEIAASARAFGINQAIPDDGTVWRKTFTLSGDLTVEHVELGVDLRHARMGDVIIEIVSPSGTVSRLLDRVSVNAEQPFGLSGTDSPVPTHLLWDFSSVQFMGEKVAGDWTVTVQDVRAEAVGSIKSLSLRAYGARDTADDTYVFTDEGFVDPQRIRPALEDESGIDTLNAAAVRTELFINLPGRTLASAGSTFQLAEWTLIENAIGGDASDRVDGNELANRLLGQSGDDTIEGGAGNDTIDGGPGRDTAVYSGSRAGFNLVFDALSKTVSVLDVNPGDGDLGSDSLKGIERIVFSDQEWLLGKQLGNRPPVMNAKVFDQPIKVGQGMAIQFELPPDLLFDPDHVSEGSQVPQPAGVLEDAPIRTGEQPGSVAVSLDFVKSFIAGSGSVLAEFELTLASGVTTLPLEIDSVRIDGQSGSSSRYTIALPGVNGSAQLQQLQDGAIDIAVKSSSGQKLVLELRVDATAGGVADGIDAIDLVLRVPEASVVNEATRVNLVSSGQGIANALKQRNSSVGELSVEATSASGGELPAWLSFDPKTRQLSGTPPEDLKGRVKLLITATDEFGDKAEDELTLQIGDNQAPTVESSRTLTLSEDAALVVMNIPVPVDPEGTSVRIEVLDIPTLGSVLRPGGAKISIGSAFDAAEIDELLFTADRDATGSAGSFRYRATDAEGVVAESSVQVFLTPVNDPPRFAPDGSLAIRYPDQSSVALDVALPSDPESTIGEVRVSEIPGVGRIELDGVGIRVGQVLQLADLSRLRFAISENVNGPVGKLEITATDPEGASARWALALSVQGQSYSSNGTAGPDSIYGSAGDDALYGLGGNDLLVGNPGNDRLIAGAGDDTLIGGSGNDLLDGSSGSDFLDGGSGADTMAGGPGNDSYVVDNALDLVIEALTRGAGGIDLIETSVSMAAPANVENLTAARDGAISLIGNTLANVLAGNDHPNSLLGGEGADTLIGFGADDTLDGGKGVDRMAGGAGNDLYRVDSRSDLVIEASGEGVDTVEAAGSYTLPAHVEHLLLLEGGDWAGGGNSLANRMVGNSGANLLSGGTGADTLEGGAGNDIYVLTDALDTLIDSAGVDTVRTAFSYTLPDFIERGELLGIQPAALTGNAGNNTLIGNPSDNILEGGDGADTLTGGAGGDGFVVSRNLAGGAPDRITDFEPGVDLVMVDLASFGIDPLALRLGSSGALGADSFVRGLGARAIDPDDYFLFDTASQALLLDRDGSGAQVPVQIAFVNGADLSQLSAGDVYLIV